jgi:lipoprotein-anchoring transpeptidase ErfK/SrfK
MPYTLRMTVTVLAAGAFLACSVSPAAQNALAATSMVQAEDVPALRLEVSLSARELYVFMAGEIVDAYPVAVGQPGHRTPTGTWEVFRIDWNPDWTPPDSPWAEEREYKPPGHPANPMGRVRMVFNPPYTVHGTEEYDSLGRAASHGSISLMATIRPSSSRNAMSSGISTRHIQNVPSGPCASG